MNKAREAAACAEANCASSFTNATNAATSATNAANSAAAAAASETNTENLWEQFNALYLGSFAVAPTTDNEGNPLQEGALYWNSVTNAMFVWNGSAWTPVQISERYLGGFAVAPTLNNQGLPLVSGNLYWNTASNNLWAHNGTSWVRTNFNETTPFLATGTTTARNLVTRFSDVVNVKDFGAKGDATTDDTVAINNAISMPFFKNIFFPPGIYRITSPIIIERTVNLIGSGSGQTYIRIDHSGNGIVFQPVGAGTSNVFLNFVEMRDISVTRSGLITNPTDNIWIRQCNGFKAINVNSYDGSTCFRFSGGQLNSLLQCRAFVGNTAIVPQFDNGLVLFEESPLSGGGAQPCYTVTIDDFIGSSTNKIDYALKIKSMDGLNFSNSYLAFCNVSLLGLTRQNVTTGLSAINISNVYFDCTGFFGGAGTPHAIQCTNALPAGQYGAAGVNITNCIIANNADVPGTFNALIDFSKKGEYITVSGCYIANSGPPWAIELYDSLVGGPSGKYIFTGNTFANTSAALGGGALYAKDVDMLVIDGNIFDNTSTSAYQVLVDGSCGSLSAIGNMTDGSATQMVSIAGATFTRNAVLLNAGQTSTNIIRLALPTSSAGLPSGSMWNNAGVVNIVP